MKIKAIFLLFYLISSALSAQNYFDKLYGKSLTYKLNSYASKGFEISSQKYLIPYYTSNYGEAHIYFNVAILDRNGDTISHKVYNKPTQSLYIQEALKSYNGFIYCGGALYDTLEKKQYFYFAKLDDRGDTLWTKKYGLLYNIGSITAMLETKDKGFLIAGYTINYDFTIHDYTNRTQIQVFKLDSLGNVQWTKNYGNINNAEDVFSIVETEDNDFLFVGRDILRGGDFQNYMFKIDRLGNLLWEKIYGNPNYLEALSSIIKTNDNNYLIGGGVNFDPNSYIIAPLEMSKITKDGNILWSKRILKVWASNLGDMVETTDGKIVITGWIYGYTRYQDAAGFIYKVNAQGDSLWMRVINRDTLIDDYISNIIKTSDNGFLLTGAGSSNELHRQDAWVLKVDSLGCLYQGCERPTATHDITEGGTYMTLYPNPAGDLVTIDFSNLAIVHKAELVVVDILGRTVKTVALDNLRDKYVLDVGDVANGSYLCVLLSEGKPLQSVKFTVIR